MTKPYADQTVEERIASLDKALNVLIHPDWRELYLRFSDDAADVRRQMEEAVNWETFVAARAVYLYINTHVLKLREMIQAEKDDLEADKAAVVEPLMPTDYERE